MLRIALCGLVGDFGRMGNGRSKPLPYQLVEDLGNVKTDSRDACPYNTMFAEQTFHDAEGVISCTKYITCCDGGATFQDGFAVISFPYWLVEM